ncbi:glycoside hydrolase family 13 protein [Zhouia sp. PK063]|uniref:glycoside hydrolase family 13 protein n=1 Tax=Zhouia sp. PK063 TaxID=3373602 RepID=UPI0037B6B29F
MKTQNSLRTVIKVVLLHVICSGMAFSVHAQVKKIEPPFWWNHMKHDHVQLMIYGDHIDQYQISFKENITIDGVIKTENPNYQFVTVDFSEITPGTYTLQFKKNNRIVFTKTYEIKQRAAHSALRKSYNSSDVIYLLMPDRFANGNTNNDSVSQMKEKANRSKQGGRHGGDIQGIIDHIPYFKDLGVTTIWSTPLCEDDDENYSYHGYAQSDVYQIDPRYGSNEKYKALASELHKNDMKLIMDYVTNHWGSSHWMIKDLPIHDWIHQFPTYTNSNYRMETQYDPHVAQTDFIKCTKGWFVPSMPDLNQDNPLVLNYLIQNAIWWIEYANLDGFRVDTYSYNDKEGIAKWTKAITDEYPNFNIVGEVWLHSQAQISYWQKDSKIGQLENYNTHLPSVMDFTLHDAIQNVFTQDQESWDTGVIRLYNNFVNDFLYPNANNILVFLENHDTGRFNEINHYNIKNYQLGLALISTVRGIPQLYYGSEIGMGGDKGKGDGDIRQDFPGGWKADTQNAFTAAGRTSTQNKFYNFTKKVLQFRKTSKALQKGKMLHYLPEHNIYVYFRILPEETIMVILNDSDKAQMLDVSRFSEGIKNYTIGTDIITNSTFKLNGELSIKAKTPMILKLSK